MHVLESGAALSPALPCVGLLRNMAIRSAVVARGHYFSRIGNLVARLFLRFTVFSCPAASAKI
jgi:hypothetical protein